MSDPIRFGMIGGGQGAFIGGVHRTAAAIAGNWRLAAGAFSSTPEKAKASGREIRLEDARNYGSWEEMLEREAALPSDQRIEAVAIVTPNHMHAPPAIAALGRRLKPILDAFEDCGVDACYELHPGEDLHDGVTFERFLEAVDNHPRANILYDPSHFLLQQLDYLDFIDIYPERIKAFHIKDAEFRPNGRAGDYGSYSNWADRPGRFRSLGDGQIDFTSIFTKLIHHGYDGWAVLEWECAYKHPEQGAAEGAPFIARHMIRKADKAFDDFVGTGADADLIKQVLAI